MMLGFAPIAALPIADGVGDDGFAFLTIGLLADASADSGGVIKRETVALQAVMTGTVSLSAADY